MTTVNLMTTVTTVTTAMMRTTMKTTASKYTIITITTTTTTMLLHLSRLPLHPILPMAQCIFPSSTTTNKLQALPKTQKMSLNNGTLNLLSPLSKTTYQDAHRST